MKVQGSNLPLPLLSRDDINFIIFLIDVSSSMRKWEHKLSMGFSGIKENLVRLSEEHNIIILRSDFSGSYKEQKIVNASDFDVSFNTGGKSIFYYSICRIRETLLYPKEGYVSKLYDEGYTPKVTLYVISDGNDEGSEKSGYGVNEATEAICDLNDHDIQTNLLLFGNNKIKIGDKLGFQNTSYFNRNSSGLANMIANIKESSQSRIVTSKTPWFANI